MLVVAVVTASPAAPAPQANSPANSGQPNQQGQTGQNGQQAASGQPGVQPKSASLACQNDLLRSHLLRGRFSSEADKMVLCPSIKNNCCTKLDQQRIYHTVNDILPQRVIEYNSKMRMAFAKLKQLHEKIVKNQPTFTGSPRRRMFCGTAARKVYNFPFNAFYEKAMDDLRNVRVQLDEYYRTYFCNICDAANHVFIDPKQKRVTIDAEFCQSFLTEHQTLVEMLNMELVSYLESLQHLVDCNHYLRSYNLKFFDARKQDFMKEVGTCINNLASKDFTKSCKSTCENIMLSKINVLMEGDYEFLIDAVNLFEKFYQYKESGNFISMKLRLFFKKFVIPRKLNARKKARFLKELRQREAKTAQRKLKIINKKLGESKKAAIGDDNSSLPQKSLHAKNNKHVKANRSAKKGERNLAQIPNQDKDLSSSATNKAEKEEEKHTLGPGRVLAEIVSNSARERNLSEKPAHGDKKPDDKKDGAHDGRPAKKMIKKAQLIYNKELFNFYSEIKVPVPSQRQYIFRIRPQPVDIDKFKKTFDMNNGINPGRFISNMKFDLPPGIFYKMLFSYRKPDQPDPNLLFFLTDFNEKMLADFKDDLTAKFKLEPEVAKTKKSKKKGRILSILNRSEKYLNENYVKQNELKDVDLLKPGN